MAVNGINGDAGGSALERFQAIRDQAKKKLDGADNRSRLSDLLKAKQAELNGKTGIKAVEVPNLAVSAKPAEQAASAFGQAAGTGAYGRAGGLEKPDPKPKLGRYIDFMA